MLQNKEKKKKFFYRAFSQVPVKGFKSSRHINQSYFRYLCSAHPSQRNKIRCHSEKLKETSIVKKKKKVIERPLKHSYQSLCLKHLIYHQWGNFEATFLLDKSACSFCSLKAFNRNSQMVPQSVQILTCTPSLNKGRRKSEIN